MMNNKTRNLLRFLAVLIVIIAVLMELDTISIPNLNPYKFWMAITGFGLMLLASK